MAEVVVTFLLDKIEYMVRKEWGLNDNNLHEISSLIRELQTMNALLKDADVKGEHDHQVMTWLQQVRDLAYDIEDVFDMFALHMTQQNAKWVALFTQFKERHFIADLINEIGSKLRKITETKERYQNIISSHSSSSSTTAANYTNLYPRIASLFVEDTDIVGFEETKYMLTSWALQGRELYKVMFVIGMGGSGKTTIVKKVYESVKKGFDCCAWITASKSKHKSNLLWCMLHQFRNPMAEAEPTPQLPYQTSEVDLMHKLQHYLQQKRYVVVLDDLWDKDVWESLSSALPKRSNRGRVIVTTRRGDIAYSCRDISLTDFHKIQPLSQEYAKQLFYNKVFSKNGTCPKQLQVWAERLLQKCEGLPLGIIEIAQCLSSEERSESRWKMLHDSLQSELTSNGAISSTMKVLFISYHDLPYHLKYCFLYLGIFPEDYTVKRRRLIRLWIAEGFIKEEAGKQLEDVGEEYLKELIGRSLVLVSDMDFDGRPRSCRVHNLMHKIILSRSRDDNFYNVCKESSRELGERTRRISIQKCTEFNKEQQNFSHVRTLFMFGIFASSRDINYSSLKLLKILHLEGASFKTLPDEIMELLLLRYLCLSNTRIRSIPKSLGNLQYLETLDLKQTLVAKLPKEIIKLDKLRHLLVCHYNIVSYSTFDCVKGFEISATEIGRLMNLQKLSFLKANRDHSREMIQALSNLTQLRKLGIIDLRREDGKYLVDTIQRLRNIQSLNLTSLHKEELLDLDEVAQPPLLRRLYLKGRLERLPVWISSLHDLVRIRLKWSKLTDNSNPIKILQDLHNLLELQLLDAYTGEQLDFCEGKFQRLKILEFEQMEQLKMVIMEGRTLPCLQKLIIRRCSRLVQVPVGIDNLSNLKELLLCDMPRLFINQLKKTTGEFHHLVRHIPRIQAYHLQANGQVASESVV